MLVTFNPKLTFGYKYKIPRSIPSDKTLPDSFKPSGPNRFDCVV